MRFLVPFVALALLLIGWRFLWRGGRDPLVVYCAHDAVYAAEILRDFEKQTGIAVAPRFDTEATKSLGLVELIVREKEAPRADVFWNNELLGMLDLQEKQLLQPYQGPGFQRIPAAFKDPGGHWTGFAARLRVFIRRAAELAESDIPAAFAGDQSRIAIAKPLYGTTLTHYSVLWQQWGREKLIAWHQDSHRRGLREVRGNAAVKDAVATGACVLGFTDTDDFFDARDAGHPVAMAPVRLESGQTICIPNTVAIVRGTRHDADARKLVDFLLSAECELALARSRSRQIPLGPVVDADLPEEVRELARWAADGVPLTGLAAARAECLAWLKSQYLP